ncbi:ComEC/Rec2 family competence protein [Cohnella zeiphila]|uniref:ComEC/Rec2 family competence protein n=1 Tax=Cohnella zeiphila TaxID=2761120 RepID=A0A7X0SH51_9BACL|nr:ComEC/Rec2 family competence protein [Cohnella zeiphila]MBB6729761.1 ComEC/Rec2 family competence protein [Cohnella zeiphila]
MKRRPLVAFVVCWTLGDALIGLRHGLPGIAAVAGALVLLLGCARLANMPRQAALACGLALVLAAGQRLWVDEHNVSQIDRLLGEDPDGASVQVNGEIASPVSIDGDTVTFKLRANGMAAGNGESSLSAGQAREAESEAGPPAEESAFSLKETVLVRIRLAAKDELKTAARWKRGDAVRVSGELQRPAVAGNFGGFDYREYLQKQRIHWSVSAKGAASVDVVRDRAPWPVVPLRMADELRSRIAALMDTIYDEPDAGYMKGLVAGIQDDVDPDQYASFSRLGLTHVLAISGLHVAVVIFILLRLGALLRLTRERSLELTIAALPAYMLLTGASPSAIRACLMGMLALYMARRNRLKDGLHLLVASALAMLVWNPLVIEDVSFQLSFIVTAGLILFVPAVSAALPLRRPGLRSSLAVAVTAQAVSFPVSVYYFHQFHLLSLLANLALVPFISAVVMPLGMASVVLAACWHPLGAIAAQAASWCNWLTDSAIAVLGSVPGMQTYWPQPSLIWVLFTYALLFAAAAWLQSRQAERTRRSTLEERLRQAEAPGFDPRERAARVAAYARQASAAADESTVPLLENPLPEPPPERRSRRRLPLAGGTLALAGLVWLLWGVQPAWLDRDAKVMFLDVGQGDSILVRTGEGKYGLIDTGGTLTFRKKSDEWRDKRDPYEVGKKTVVPLLKQRGVRSLDWLVLTHLDQDHIGGAAAVLADIPVKRILFNGSIKPDGVVDRLFQMADERGIPMYAAEEGLSWSWGRSARLTALYPQGEETGGAIPVVKEQNDRSVVLLLALYGRTFLLPGDLEAPGERRILRDPVAASLPAYVDVLKTGHHGSRTSTSEDWLRRWNPAQAVISVGRNNTYGHPNEEVLDRLNADGIPYFRTDENGEIQYRVSPSGRLERREMKASAPPSL